LAPEFAGAFLFWMNFEDAVKQISSFKKVCPFIFLLFLPLKNQNNG
jgi:hypothetical protein